MPTYYLDYELGNDASSGSSWDSAWQTITNGATAARIAPGDIIRIAKSGSPTSIGTATWTDLSKTVSLTSGSLNPNIDRCEVAWTANPSGDTTVTLTGVASDAKEGSYCMKFTLDAAVQANTMQAYSASGSVLDLSSYQKISLWLKNEAAIIDDNWTITLCADTAGSSVVDTFRIPPIPSTARWLPLTLARNGGGNLGSAIQSVAVNSGSIVTGMASKYIYLDNIIACTTDGLNLQSLISKNSAESGGAETWYGIQSINGTTVLLDNDTNTKANAGRGYSGSTETAPTYKRETIKTALGAGSSTVIQEVQDSGANGNNIQFQGGYNTSTNEQDGETFFDGLNGNGYGIQLSIKSYITLNRLSAIRYNYGIYLTSSINNTISTVTAANNNNSGVYLNTSFNNTIGTVTAANNNSQYGIYLTSSSNNIITTVTAANNNLASGLYIIYSFNNTISTVTAANNNNNYGVYLNRSQDNITGTLTTENNTFSSLATSLGGYNAILNATLGEATKLTSVSNYDDAQIRINDIGGYSNIWTDYGNIVSQNASAGGSGLEWKMNVTNVGRASYYPLKLKLAEVAINEGATTTVKTYFKKSHATDIAAALVCSGSQIAGVSASVVAYCPDDTNRNQLQIEFTPSGSGVVEIEAWAWWNANTADENVIVDDIEIT